MPKRGAFARWGRYLLAAGLAAVVTWFAFIANHEVPILDWFDLGVHEVGHLLLAFAPRMVMFIAGSAAQVMVPLALAWYFGIQRRDAAGGGFCLAWAGASMWDVSVYIADAPTQALPLIGGGQHDWAYLLGPDGWGVMHMSSSIAGFVQYTGATLAGVGVLVALAAAFGGIRGRAPVTATPVPIATRLPHEPDPWLAAAELPFIHDRAVGE